LFFQQSPLRRQVFVVISERSRRRNRSNGPGIIDLRRKHDEDQEIGEPFHLQARPLVHQRNLHLTSQMPPCQSEQGNSQPFENAYRGDRTRATLAPPALAAMEGAQAEAGEEPPAAKMRGGKRKGGWAWRKAIVRRAARAGQARRLPRLPL